jgi:hypothetical protein
MLPAGSPQKLLVDRVSAKLHAEDYFGAARIYAEYVKTITGTLPPTKEKAEATLVLSTLLHWCLENNGYEEAAQLLWGPTQFDPRPESTQRVWRAFEDSDMFLLMGAGSMSKSYSIGVRLFLEWIRDPENTHVKVGGPSEAHLKENLFNHLVQLHRQSTIPLPGKAQDLFIGLDSKSRKGAISGVVIPLGQTGAGRLQGTKRMQRKKPHPVFGTQTRMFVFLDEIANIPNGIWRDIDNVLTQIDGTHTLKVGGAFNPTDQASEVAKRCEPPDGWGSFDSEQHFDWTSKRGWRVVRLDAARCENVVQRKIVFPGLQTYEGLQTVILNSGGTDSPGYWAMGRGCFPPTGTSLSIIPMGMLLKLKAEVIWYENPTPVGGVDLALEGGDVAEFYKGSFGLASGIKFPPSVAHPNGETIMFKNHKGRPVPRLVLLAESNLSLPRGDTIVMKDEVMRVGRSFGIRPDHCAVDRTGNGQGVYDLLRFEWGEVIGVNYSESAGETRIMVEDHDIAKELYARVDSELMFAMRKFAEFGYLYIDPAMPTEELFSQLSGRLFRMQGKRARVEGKPDYKSRNAGRSPDKGDGFALLVHAARKAFGYVPGMSAENSQENYREGSDDGYDDQPRISIDNRFEDLDVGN